MNAQGHVTIHIFLLTLYGTDARFRILIKGSSTQVQDLVLQWAFIKITNLIFATASTQIIDKVLTLG